MLFVSWHQSPLYPGSGALDEIGGSAAEGHTVNVPLPALSTGDSYQASLEGAVGSIIDRFDPTWLLISAGFDAHRDDPLTEMGLSAGDYADLTTELMSSVPPESHDRVPRGRLRRWVPCSGRRPPRSEHWRGSRSIPRGRPPAAPVPSVSVISWRRSSTHRDCGDRPVGGGGAVRRVQHTGCSVRRRRTSALPGRGCRS